MATVASKPGSTLRKNASLEAAPAATCWALCRDFAGMRSQVEGLARAVGLPTDIKTTCLRLPWRYMPFWSIPLSNRTYDGCDEGWDEPPRLVISCGRHAVVPSLCLKKRFGTRVVTVHLQDPTINPRKFDLVVSPRHDGLRGPNVWESLGALHKVTSQDLRDVRGNASPWCTDSPLVTVLLGGPNGCYSFGAQDVERFIGRLRKLADENSVCLAIIPSRRTPEFACRRMAEAFGREHYVWSLQGDNPYLQALAQASYLVVTGDSVSMVSEASATGRPIFVEHMTEGRYSVRFSRFHDQFREAGITRPFEGQLGDWKYQPPNATQAVADAIRDRLGVTPT